MAPSVGTSEENDESPSASDDDFRGICRAPSDDDFRGIWSKNWTSRTFKGRPCGGFPRPCGGTQQCIMKKPNEYTPEDYSQLMDTNLEAPYHLCQLAYPLLKASGNGSIVMISSVAGHLGVPSVTVYAMTKGALNQLTKNLACEWAEDNIRVNSVAPWVTPTPLLDTLEMEDEMKQTINGLVQRSALKRPGVPQETSGLVAFLCLPAASYITGQIISVDGGTSVYGGFPG